MDLAVRRRHLVRGVGAVVGVLVGIFALGQLLDRAFMLPSLPRPLWPAGAILLFLGVLIEIWGTKAFWRTGGGTPNPAAAPLVLVTEGPYRFSRNPLYIGRLSILAGVALLFASTGTGVLTLGLFLGIQFLLLPKEETRLEERFGAEYERYCARVSRWITLRPRP